MNLAFRIVLSSAIALTVAACDPGDTLDPNTGEPTITEADASNGGGADATADVGADIEDPVGPRYFAVYVADTPDYDCSPISKNHGADIDAAELKDSLTGDSIGFVTNAAGAPGDGSANCKGTPAADKQVPDEFVGAPDGDLSGGFVALAGGYITGEFGATEITSAYTIQIYEVGVDECGDQNCKDDPMEVGLATDASCDVFSNGCSIMLSGTAVGDATIPVGAF